MRNYGAIPESCSRCEGCKTKVFVSATSAFGTGRELNGELLCGNTRRILQDVNEYEGKEYDGQYVQHHR